MDHIPEEAMEQQHAAAAAEAAAQHQQQQAAAAAAHHHQLLELQQRLAALEGGMNAWQQRYAHLAYPASSSGLKAPKPDVFKGTKSEAATVRLWVLSLDTYFATVNLSDTDQLKFSLTLLRESALLWWNSLAIKPATFTAFKDALVDYYQPVSAQLAARDELAHLQQTGSVKAYTDAFKRCLTNIPDMSDNEKVDRYHRGLKRDIRVQVALSRVQTLDAAIEVAERTDEILYGSRRSTALSSLNRSGPSVFRSHGPKPMELGAMPAQRQARPQQQRRTYAQAVTDGERRFPRLTPEERQRLRDSGGCFYCRGSGHFTSECPLKRRLRAQRR